MPSKGCKLTTEVTASEKKKLEPTNFFTCRKKPAAPLYRKAKTNSSVLVSCGPVRPPTAVSLHHIGWKKWLWSIKTYVYLGPAAWYRPGLNGAAQRLGTTMRTLLYSPAQAFSPVTLTHSNETFICLPSLPDCEPPVSPP